MTTIRCLAAVAGLLVLACCTRVENTHLSSPVLPMQEPTHAAQAPVLDLNNVLHVGAAAAPAVDALPPAARHGGASVHHGELPNAVTRAELVAYLHEDAISYVPTGGDADFDVQLFPDGLLLRFAADPPIVRVAKGTPPALVDEAVRVVQILNMALPRDWQIGFGDEPGPAGTAEPSPSEVIIAFAAQEDWPEEVRPPEGGNIGLALPRYELYATGDPDRPFNLEITGGRIWIDPTRTEGDERLGVIAHELIHVLGRDHPDPARFPDSIMVAGGGDGPTEHILHPLDRAALLAVYNRVEPGGTPDAIDLGPWADTSTHIYGVLGLPTGEVAFGAAFSNGLLGPWASGPAPDTALAENPSLAGTTRWSGRLLGLTTAAETVAGVADLAVHLEPAFLTRIWWYSDSLLTISVLVLIRMGFNKTGCFQDALCGLRQTGGVCRLRRRRDHLGRRCPVTARTGAPDTSVRTHGGLFHRSPGSRTPNPCPSRPVGSTGLRDGARL